MHEALQEILAGVAEIEAADAARRDAFEQAVGMYINDVVDPEVGVFVWQGRIAEIQIADKFCKRERGDVEATLNAVIINAFEAWHSDYMRRLGASGALSA